MSYTQLANWPQDLVDEPPFVGGENPCEADMIGDGDEYQQFRQRLDISTLLIGICSDYEHGICTAEVTIRRLEIGGLLETPDALCRLICAGVRALAEGART